jgi:flavin-dependent dehydrogenase
MEAFIRKLFASRFGSARREGPVLGAFPLEAHVDRVAGPGWLLVGDAAGMVDPISGEGMSLALQGAELAAHAVTDFLEKTSADPFQVYATRLRRLRRPIERVTAAMLFLSRHRGVARVALARDERLAPLMRVATGEPGLLTRIAGL